MHKLMLIRSIIFLTAGIITIIFGKQLNNIKNKILIKLNFKPRDERNSYFTLGIIFIVIAIILFLYSLYNS